MTRALDLGVEDVTQILNDLYGLSPEGVTGTEYLIYCPAPDHTDSRPSCSINIDSGYWNCFSCNAGGDIVDLGAVVLKKSRMEVVNLLKKEDPDTLLQTFRSRLGRLKPYERAEKAPEPPQGPYEDGPMAYLRARGFKRSTIERWGVRWCNEQTLMGVSGKEFTIKASIALPVRDKAGNLKAWIYRRTDSSPSWQPRYINSNEVSSLWFGNHLYGNAAEVVVCEGPLDALAVDQAGWPALGLCGAQMHSGKASQLLSHKAVYLFADADAAGMQWVSSIGGVIGTQVHLRVVRYPTWVQGKDPGDLPGVDIELMLERAVPWLTWMRTAITKAKVR